MDISKVCKTIYDFPEVMTNLMTVCLPKEDLEDFKNAVKTFILTASYLEPRQYHAALPWLRESLSGTAATNVDVHKEVVMALHAIAQSPLGIKDYNAALDAVDLALHSLETFPDVSEIQDWSARILSYISMRFPEALFDKSCGTSLMDMLERANTTKDGLCANAAAMTLVGMTRTEPRLPETFLRQVSLSTLVETLETFTTDRHLHTGILYLLDSLPFVLSADVVHITLKSMRLFAHHTKIQKLGIRVIGRAIELRKDLARLVLYNDPEEDVMGVMQRAFNRFGEDAEVAQPLLALLTVVMTDADAILSLSNKGGLVLFGHLLLRVREPRVIVAAAWERLRTVVLSTPSCARLWVQSGGVDTMVGVVETPEHVCEETVWACILILWKLGYKDHLLAHRLPRIVAQSLSRLTLPMLNVFLEMPDVVCSEAGDRKLLQRAQKAMVQALCNVRNPMDGNMLVALTQTTRQLQMRTKVL